MLRGSGLFLDHTRFVTLEQFGARGDGTTDDTASFQAAAATGRSVAVPYTVAGYRITGTVTMTSGARFYGTGGDRPRLVMDSASVSRMFDFNGVSGAGLRDLVLDGNKTITPSSDFMRIRDCSDVLITEVDFDNMPGTNAGGVVLSGTTTRTTIRRCSFDAPEGTAVYLTGASITRNRIENIDVNDGGGFGVFAGQGATRNQITGVHATNTAKEGVALTFPCHHNRIEDCCIEGAGDNGISVSGNWNVVSGNQCLYNSFAGVGVWGAYNTVSANVCIGNDQALTADWAGVWIDNGYGGTGSQNMVVGNVTDDPQTTPTQKWGVRIKGNAYTLWTAGLVVTASSYIYYGLNIYQAAGAGTTGATPPTHTSGSVSDGGVTWTYINTAVSQVTPRTNVVANNVPGRVAAGGQQFIDISNWVNNMLIGYGKDVRVPWPTSSAGLLTGQIYANAGVLTVV